ncbi:MAG: RluA family pseudouridine synthase [Candidatus Shapirobacteria bacterium]
MTSSPRIIFQDKDLLVLDKPAGWIVNRSQTTFRQETLQDWLEREMPCQVRFERAGIVHRLDKETSGLLLVAKNEKAFEELQSQFKNRQVKKEYLVLLHGRVIPVEGSIQAAISRHPLNRHKFGVFLGGRSAQTEYQLVTFFPSSQWGSFSLVKVQPRSGRTHQIRVHFKHLGFAVVGDLLYAGRKVARQDRRWCPRQFLHAAALEFRHPRSRQPLFFTSPLPEVLQRALNNVK